MALTIKDYETQQLASRLAQCTGESISTAVCKAIEIRLSHFVMTPDKALLLEDLERIRLRCSTLPIIDSSEDKDLATGHEAPE